MVPPTGVRSARTFANFIFDFDGTLVDSARDVLDCLRKAFETCGISLHSYDSRIIMQFQLMETIAALAPAITTGERERVAERFREIYDSIDYPNTVLMPTVVELLSRLRERAAGMYIVSNKRAVPTLRILNKLNVRNFFTGVFNPDMYVTDKRMNKKELLAHALEKHSLPKETTVYIGDSEADVTAARGNDISAVAVENGYGDVADFTIKPDHTVQKIIEILTLS